LARKGGIFNLTDGHHPTIKELELGISHALGLKPPPKISTFFAQLIGYIGDLLGKRAPINSERLSKITSTLIFDDSKARTELDWSPTRVTTRFKELVSGHADKQSP